MFVKQKKLIIILSAALLLLFAPSSRSAFNPPGQSPPSGNVDAPIYSVGTDQTLSGGLQVTSGGFTSSSSSGSAITGTSAMYGLQGIVVSDSAGGDSALYANAFGGDATDYSAVLYGGLGLQLASGDIYYLSRDSGITWPRVLDGAALYGLSVTSAGELRLLGHGAGINFLNQSVSSLLTVSEEGVVDVAAGGALRVGGVDVCLEDGTNCSVGEIATNIVSSVDGVINDGGNIDLIAGSGITLVPDDAANTITISAAGGGSDITTATCGAETYGFGTLSCDAVCPAGYEVVNAEITCTIDWTYFGEGGSPGSWSCAKLAQSGQSDSDSVRFYVMNMVTSSAWARVYGQVWCIQN